MSTDRAVAWIPSDQEFGARLALVRQRMGWNIKEAALACNLPPQSWRGWESGHSPRNLSEIADKISTRTGVDDYWLMTGRAQQNGPRPEKDEGRDVRHQGLEPRTRWFRVAALSGALPGERPSLQLVPDLEDGAAA